MKASPNLIISSLALLSVSTTVHSQTNPNYVVILADDLGYGDLSCHGGKTPTPNIDKLFKQGVEFKNFMTCPVSSPTRAGLLTGLNPLRTGQGPNTDGQLDKNIPNMGSIFQKNGYKTGLFGKWHNGETPEIYPTLPYINDYGFDRFIGFYGGGCDYYTKIDGNDETPRWYHDKTPVKNEFGYATDLITKYALDFIELNKANKFLAYIPFNVIHTPLHVKDVDLQRVPASILQAAGGTLRTWKEYYKLYNDVFNTTFNPKYIQLTGDNSITAFSGILSDAEIQVLYSAMLISLDDKVGEIMKYLEDNNLANNTVVLFFSDNGATPTGSSLPFRGNKHSTEEGGVHAPAAMYWPAGGIVGPKTFKPMVGHVDVLPTFMEMSGIPSSAVGKIDGSSFLQELKTDAQESNREYYWVWRDHDVIRTDRWKLNRYFDSYELFDIQSDITESTNVYANNPTVAADLITKLDNWRVSTGIAATHLTPILSAPINPAPSQAVLKVTANCIVDATHPQLVIQILGAGHKMLPGDYLHFDIKADVSSKTDGLYLSHYVGTPLYFNNDRGVDQFGRLQSSAPAPLGGAGVWEHRVIGIGNEAPIVANKMSIIFKKTGNYTVYIDNLQIRRADGSVVDIWSNSTRVSATTPLYTISTGTNYKLEASWEQSYSITVNGGSGSGSYTSGVPVTIKANAPQVGLAFDKWIINSGSPIIANIYDANTTVANSTNSVITATYGNAGPHALTVNSGTGSGSFAAGSVVNISSDEAAAGQVFNKWIINSGTPVITDIYNPSTSLKTPTNASSVTATYINFLDACDATTGWNATSTLNTTDIKQGTGSLQYVGSGTPEFSKVFEPFNPNIPTANAALKFWYYVSDVTKFATNNQVELGSGGKNDAFEYNWTLTGLVNGWNYVNLKISSAGTSGGTPNFEALNWFRIYHGKTGEMTTKIDAIEISGIPSNQTSPTGGIENVKVDDSSFNMYPNLVSKEGMLSIHVKEPEISTIKILNLNGQVFYSKNLAGVTYLNIALNPILKSGVYIVSLSSKKSVVSQKLIVR